MAYSMGMSAATLTPALATATAMSTFDQIRKLKLSTIKHALPAISPTFSKEKKHELAEFIEEKARHFAWELNEKLYTVIPFFCHINGEFYVEILPCHRSLDSL